MAGDRGGEGETDLFGTAVMANAREEISLLPIVFQTVL